MKGKRGFAHARCLAMGALLVVLGGGCSQPTPSPIKPAPLTASPANGDARLVQKTPTESGPAPARASFVTGVTVHLERQMEGGKVISFGLPLPRGARVNPANVRLKIAGSSVNLDGVRVKPILFDYDELGKEAGARSLVVQLPASVMSRPSIDIDITWDGIGPGAPTTNIEPYAQAKRESTATAKVADRVIEKVKNPISPYQLVVKNQLTKPLFTGWEPTVLATFPPSYLNDTYIFSDLMSRQDLVANRNLKGLVYLSDALGPWVDSNGLHEEGYPLAPKSVPDPANAEGWLYDRCATFLLTYAHLGEARHLRHAYRSCSYYSSKISIGGANSGIFTGKREPDTKYSHLRGLYMYYALTGDEDARVAGKAIADLWRDDRLFTETYRKGTIRGPDKLWTERLLAVDLEAMIYGFLLLGDVKYLTTFKELFDTAHKHLSTTSQAELDAITKVHFPPQNCLVHSAEQHAEGNAKDPWCSGWMAEMLIDPLLRFQELTKDSRVDDVFIRLARTLRDAGTNYFKGDSKGDTFLDPLGCFEPHADFEDVRVLVPLYGFGISAEGKRKTFGEYGDFEHCADATALTAAAIRALRRQRLFDGPGVGPFKTEGESFLALHEELSYCAKRTFGHFTRPARDPRKWKSDQLQEGYANGDERAQGKWIDRMSLGYPTHVNSPERRLSWWFNGSLAQYRLLEEADVSIPAIRGGIIPCKARAAKTP